MNKDIPANCENPAILLKERQQYSLKGKIHLSKERIKEWYEYWDGQVYVSFSGGKDSTVLLHLVRSLYPEIPAVFADTGLEYPEIKEFVNSTENTITIKPKLSYRQVIDKYGYPVISKTISMGCDRYRNTKSEEQRQLRLHGGINPTSGKQQQRTIPIKKYHYLINAPFKISEKCCDALKKSPAKQYTKDTGRKPYVGLLATNSNLRLLEYKRFGCNAYKKGVQSSRPLMFWTDDDIWKYLKDYNIPYCKIYDMGENKTGCMWCMFGVQYDETPNRFQRMKKTHPKIYDYCINKLNLGEVLDYINVNYT